MLTGFLFDWKLALYAGFVAAAGYAVAVVLALPGLAQISVPDAFAQQDLGWGTSAVGSSGHRALTALANVLNPEMKKYQITVQPTPGAVVSVKGYATGKFDGYYGADIAFIGCSPAFCP